jgi:hypothetical protein
MHRLVILCAVVGLSSLLTVSDACASDVPGAAPLHEAESDIDGGRMRAGIEALGGAGFATGGVSGPVVGMNVRLGWQFDRRVAVCLQGAAFWWDSSKTATSSSTTATGSYGLQVTPMFSLTPNDTIDLAAGPSLDVIGTPHTTAVLVDAASPAQERTIYSGSAFGMHGRFAVLLHEVSKVSPRARVGLALSAQMHATFVDRGIVSMFTLGLGSEWY